MAITPKNLRLMAERFDQAADNKAAVESLIADARTAHPKDPLVTKLCDDIEAATDADAIRALCTAAKAPPPTA